MQAEHSTDAPTSASQIMCRFVASVNDGTVRGELTDNCVLSLFSGSVKGATAVTGYVRTQLTGRFKHVGFQQAHQCSKSQENFLDKRFARSFRVLKRRQRVQQVRETRVSTIHLRAESDSDDNDCPGADAYADSRKSRNKLITPPRAAPPATEHLQYIESLGVLETTHEQDDGGLRLEDCCQVRLTLGYRCDTLAYKSEYPAEIYLVVYEKHEHSTLARPGLHRTPGLQRNVPTDDEAEEIPARRVRRALFASDETEHLAVTDLTLPVVEGVSALPVLTPCKRQNKSDSSVKSKRLNIGAGLRF